MSRILHPMTNMKKEKLALAFRALDDIESIEVLCEALENGNTMDEDDLRVFTSIKNLIHYHRLVLEYAFHDELEELRESDFPNLWDRRYEKRLLQLSSLIDDMHKEDDD